MRELEPEASTMNESDDNNLRDSEVALMDAIKTILEILMTAGVKPEQIDKLLASQTYPQVMPRATFVIDSLRKFVRDLGREEHREQVRRIREEPPAGSA
jgi:hypothetical protein